jgi:hypothetical protein
MFYSMCTYRFWCMVPKIHLRKPACTSAIDDGIIRAGCYVDADVEHQYIRAGCYMHQERCQHLAAEGTSSPSRGEVGLLMLPSPPPPPSPLFAAVRRLRKRRRSLLMRLFIDDKMPFSSAADSAVSCVGEKLRGLAPTDVASCMRPVRSGLSTGASAVVLPLGPLKATPGVGCVRDAEEAGTTALSRTVVRIAARSL